MTKSACDKIYHYWQKLCDNDMVPCKSVISPELFADGDFYTAFLVCNAELRTVEDTVFSQPKDLPSKFHLMMGSPKINSLKAMKELTDTFLTALTIPSGVVILYAALNEVGEEIGRLELIYLPVKGKTHLLDTLFAVGSLVRHKNGQVKGSSEVMDLLLEDIHFFELSTKGKAVSYRDKTPTVERLLSDLAKN